MAKATKAAKEQIYEPDGMELVRTVDEQLEQKLTGKIAVEDIATALRAAAFEFDPDDAMTVSTAEDLQVQDAEEYARGYELMAELGALESRISNHYARFDKPLNFLTKVVRSLKSPQVEQVTPIKQALSRRLGAWKYAQDEKDRQEREAAQKVADAVARSAQEAKAEALERVATVEPNPQLAASFRKEAEAVRQVSVAAAPVEHISNVPVVEGGYTRTLWKCEYVDLKELLRAYVEGRCFLDEDAIKEGLQSFMDKQASSLQRNLSKAFPGTNAVPVPTGVARKRG